LRTLSGTYSGLFVEGIPHPKGTVITEHYLNEYWNVASILLKDSEIVLENYLVKYNIKDEVLEIKMSTDTKITLYIKNKEFGLTDSVTKLKSYLVNGLDFAENDQHLSGLLEVLVDGKKPLLKRTTIYIKKADYNVALNVGSRDETAYHALIFTFLQITIWVKVKNKKDLLINLQDRKELVDSFIDDQKMNVKKEKDLIRVLDFYNSQFKKGS